MLSKTRKIIFISVLAILLITQSALATDYITEDTGYIQGTEIQLDGVWQSRPGLDTFPPPAQTFGPYPIRSQLIEGSAITSVVFYHGPPGGGPWNEQSIESAGGPLDFLIPPIDPEIYGFNYCQPEWEYSFYLNGFDQNGELVEHDERHYAGNPDAGDPYVFQINNPEPNQPPVADPNGPYEGDRGEPITLDGTGSSDPEGSGLIYEWDIYVTWSDYEPHPYYDFDDSFVDGSGASPTFYFDENGEYHVRLRVTDECGEEHIAETTIMVYDPHMVVIPQDNNIAGINWRPDLMLTLKIDGFIYDTVPVEPMGDKDGFGYNFNMDDYGVEVVPGMDVVLYGDYDTTVIGDEFIRPHTVRDFTILFVDLDEDVVGGTADPGTYVRVRINDPYWVELVEWADPSGNWEADFAGFADIQPETFVNVLQQNDFDSSHTLLFWGDDSSPPIIEANLPYNWIAFHSFTPNSTISLEIYDTDGTTLLFSGTVDTDGDGHGWNDWHGVDIVPDTLIEATDDATGTLKQLVLEDIAVVTFDIENDYLAGYGPPDDMLGMFVGNEFDVYESDLYTDSNGDWDIDLTGVFDITDDMGHQVFIADEDGDFTTTEFVEPMLPFFTIEPEHRWAHGESWPIGVPITITIYAADPANGILYQDIQESYPAEHNPEFGAVDFDLQEVEGLERGLYVTMTDGETFKDTWIADLYYDYLDVGLDTAGGHGPGGTYGFMVATYTDGFFMELPDNEAGDWTADFGSAGFDATNVPDTFILRWDEDGDETMIHLPEPLFIEGSVPVDPVEVGTTIQISATFESFLFNGPDDPLLDITFCLEVEGSCMDPSNWLPASALTDVSPNTTGVLETVISEPGVYPVITHAFNPDGPDSYEFLGLLVVYDPSAGFVTGGGWIDSPEGAYTADPTLTGRANFGFVSKYKRGATVPTGNTEFQFHAGDLNFHSRDYEWLVVTGSNYARFKGTGTINGEGEYKFMIWAGDGEPDTFRIRIWEEDEFGNETIIYDNGFDQGITGGNIVVHDQ
jgi:hypothetical protein